jgi:hypothetical protein
MTRQKIAEYVQKWMDEHEPDTFVKNKFGVPIYSAGHSSLNIQTFFEMLLEDFINDDGVVLPQANVIKSLPLDEIEKKVDELLHSETKETLTEWLKTKR